MLPEDAEAGQFASSASIRAPGIFGKVEKQSNFYGYLYRGIRMLGWEINFLEKLRDAHTLGD